MKKLNLAILVIAFFTLQSSLIFAQANKLVTAKRVKQTDKKVKPIEAYAKKIENFVKAEKKPHLVIADVSDFNKDEKPIWKKYASEAEFEKARETQESYEIAYIWNKNNKPVAVNFTYSSPSGDWAQYVYYIFREDGSVARADRELRTFMGDIIVNRIYIYDETGKLLKETKTFRDLETQKPVKATKNFQDMDVKIYKSINTLPFASMLSSDATDEKSLSDAEKKFVPKGWKLEEKTVGDLNKDSLPDSILQIVDPNPDAEDYNRNLIILFKTKNGGYTKVAESKRIIRCTSCGGMLGGGPADISVKKGVMIISQMYGSRNGVDYLHRLRYEPATKRFRLIGEDINEFDRLDLTSKNTSTNYLTGRQIIKTSKGGENDVKETVKRKRIPKTKKYLRDINYNNY